MCRKNCRKKVSVLRCVRSVICRPRQWESTKDYPMREFLNAGLKVTVNTDNRTVSNTTLTKELEFIQKTYGITDEEIHLMMRNAVDVAFADDAVKERMLKYV